MKISKIQRDVMIRMIDGEAVDWIGAYNASGGVARWRGGYFAVPHNTFRALLDRGLITTTGGAFHQSTVSLSVTDRGKQAVARYFTRTRR